MKEFYIWDFWIEQPNSFYQIDPALTAWLNNNARGEYDVFFKGTATSIDKELHSNEVTILFYDDNVAMLFKLWWLAASVNQKR